ncbi:MAG: hypothetical protein ACI391_09185 [Muribaculaceae bacterium]
MAAAVGICADCRCDYIGDVDVVLLSLVVGHSYCLFLRRIVHDIAMADNTPSLSRIVAGISSGLLPLDCGQFVLRFFFLGSHPRRVVFEHHVDEYLCIGTRHISVSACIINTCHRIYSVGDIVDSFAKALSRI